MNVSFWVLIGLFVDVSFAQPPTSVVSGEQVRIKGEMERLANRGVWAGVERYYEKLVALESAGDVVSHADHLLGAQAASQRGELAKTRTRLLLAVDQDQDGIARRWLHAIDEEYGWVRIEISGIGPDDHLTPTDQLYGFEANAAVGYAQAQLENTGQFEGYLPVGQFILDSRRLDVTSDSFDVVSPNPDKGTEDGGGSAISSLQDPQSRVQQQSLDARQRAHPSRLYSRTGVGWGTIGNPTGQDPQPDGFHGVNSSIGFGVTTAFWRRVGVGAEVGWQGTFGANTEGLTPYVSMGTGWLYVNIDWDRILWSIGPVAGTGIGQAHVSIGTDDVSECVTNACDDLAFGGRATSASIPLRGRINGVGFASGWVIPVTRTGPVDAAVGITVQSVFDSARWYPVASLSLIVGYRSRRG